MYYSKVCSFATESAIGVLIVTMDYTHKQSKVYEPRYDKTNKMSVRPAKTQVSLGIRPV